jgi:hypothetical protein
MTIIFVHYIENKQDDAEAFSTTVPSNQKEIFYIPIDKRRGAKLSLMPER